MTNLQANFAAMAAGDSGAPEVTKDALKTGTGNTSAVGFLGQANITMAEYCFSPDIYVSSRTNTKLSGSTTNGTNQAGRFSIVTITSSINYDVDWRYITASDKPFLYFIRDKKTGAILYSWWCDDPPPGYWHLSNEEKANIESGGAFDRPVQIDHWEDSKHESFTKFDYPDGMESFREWTQKGKANGHGFAKHMSDNFDFDSDSKIFKPKNLQEI